MFELLKQSATPKVPVIRTLDDLKQHKHWVCYDPRQRIVSPITGQGEDGLHPMAWGSFEQALKLWHREGSSIRGLGFMLTQGLGITIVDLHHCLRDGQLNGFAQEMVETLDSYTEILPGGTGLRIWVQNLLPRPLAPRSEEKKNADLKEKARLIVVTGKVWEVE